MMKNEIHTKFTFLLTTYGAEEATYLTELEMDFYLSYGEWNKALFHANVLKALTETI